MKFNKIVKPVVFCAVLTGCLKDPNIAPTIPGQLFRPIGFSGNVNIVSVAFNWTPIKDANYLLEISRDSLLFERDVESILIEGKAQYLMENLWSLSRYSARIKAISKIPGIEDSGYQTITFVTALENLFYSIDSGNISTTSIALHWEPDNIATRIDVLSGDEAVQQIPLSEDQLIAGSALVEELSPDTSYTFKIYNDEILRGTIAGRTSP